MNKEIPCNLTNPGASVQLFDPNVSMDQHVDHINSGIPFYRYIWYVYFLPACIILGTIDNLMALWALSNKTVTINKKYRSYYQVLSLLEILTILGCHFLDSYLGESLFLTSGGKYSLYVSRLSDFQCSFWSGMWTFITSITQYTVMMYCVENCFSILDAFNKPKFVQRYRSIIFWILLAFIPSAYLCIFTAVISNMRKKGVGQKLCDFFYSHLTFMAYCVSSCAIRYTIHIVVILVCNVVIIRKLRITNQQIIRVISDKAKLPRRGSAGAFKSSKICIILCSIQGVTHLPALIICISLCSLQYSSQTIQHSNALLIKELHHLYYLSNSMTIFNNITDFVVYFIEIPSFRHLINNIFR